MDLHHVFFNKGPFNIGEGAHSYKRSLFKENNSSGSQMHNFGFVFRTAVFTVILITVLTKDGSGEGIHHVFFVSTENMDLNQVDYIN